MADVPWPLLVFLLLFIITIIIVSRHQRYMNAQRNLPDRDAFLAAHGNEVRCHKCAGTQTAEHGLDSKDDPIRIVTCADCKALLYQFRREQDAA